MVSLVTYAAGFLVYGYVAYSAFAMGRALSDSVHQRQALGLGVVVVLMVVLFVFSTVFPPGTDPRLLVVGLSLYYAVFIGTYYWVDASVRAARLTDPLLRDTLHWSKLRVAFWAYDIVAYFVFLVSGVFFDLTYSNGPPLFVLFLIAPAFIMVFSAAVVLPVAAYRSRDRALRRNLGWFGVFALVALNAEFGVLSLVFPNPVSAANLAELIVTVVAGYFLYLSVTSLVPLYRFGRERPAKA